MLNGQAHHHNKTIEDFEAVVRDAQRKFHISPARTVIYGRSAGGMMVGATTARNPDGRLMGATYTEVPFVDGVRSQTNPRIPLVESGFSEYGNPIESVANFRALFSISPMNTMPTDGAPGVFVLCRTGLKDLQVLPYEPVKWVQRLRGNSNPPAGKFLAYEKDEAHVYTIPRYYEARGHDLAILDLWAEGRLRQPLAGTIKNRKIRYTMAQQKRQQKKQDGGKRKSRRASRKAGRKTRRATRRQQRK
jgi:oligopeptidase B